MFCVELGRDWIAYDFFFRYSFFSTSKPNGRDSPAQPTNVPIKKCCIELFAHKYNSVGNCALSRTRGYIIEASQKNDSSQSVPGEVDL